MGVEGAVIPSEELLAGLENSGSLEMFASFRREPCRSRVHQGRCSFGRHAALAALQIGDEGRVRRVGDKVLPSRNRLEWHETEKVKLFEVS